MSVKKTKALIIGNGGSSVNLHASNLHKGKDVFRINKFFLEPQKIHGSKIKYLVIPGAPFFIFFADYLVKNNTYSIENCIYKKLHKRFFIPDTNQKFIEWNQFVEQNGCNNSVDGFDGANQINSNKELSKITTGPFLTNCSVKLGYKDISIIGIDFYSEKSSRKYPVAVPKYLTKILPFSATFSSPRMNKLKGNSYDVGHSIKADIAYFSEIISSNQDVCFTIYVDDKNTFKIWSRIKGNNNNIDIVQLDPFKVNLKSPNCESEILLAIDEYRKKYFLVHLRSTLSHLFAHRRAIIRKMILILRELLINKLK